MIVEAIVSASYGNKSHPHCLYLSKAQISDIVSQNTKGLRVLYNHKGPPIGSVQRMYKDERDNLVAVMKITDRNIKKGVLNKTIIGASPNLVSFPRDDIYIIAKGILEISLTEEQELPESLIIDVKMDNDDGDDKELTELYSSFNNVSIDEEGIGFVFFSFFFLSYSLFFFFSFYLF